MDEEGNRTGTLPVPLVRHIGELTDGETRWVLLRAQADSDAEADRRAGFTAGGNTHSKEFVVRRRWLRGIAREVMLDREAAVLQAVERAAIEAALVKVEGLRSKSESVRQACATELLDRFIGKPSVEVTHRAPALEQLASLAQALRSSLPEVDDAGMIVDGVARILPGDATDEDDAPTR